jgi:hypothetical protein
MEFHGAALEAKAEVPMAFQSALAGILLVAELVRDHPLPHTVTQIEHISRIAGNAKEQDHFSALLVSGRGLH